MNKHNEMYTEFRAISENEGFARVAVASFATALNPTMEELADIKTAVSEAVTNCIIHAYEGSGEGKVILESSYDSDILTVIVTDHGRGIENIEKAMEPLFTTSAQTERSGMGFSFMEAFMDELEVESKTGNGTRVIMKKKIGSSPYIAEPE